MHRNTYQSLNSDILIDDNRNTQIEKQLIEVGCDGSIDH